VKLAGIDHNPYFGDLDMEEKQPIVDAPVIPPPAVLKSKVLQMYGRYLDAIVTSLVFVMLLILLGAVAGLVLDFIAAATAFQGAVHTHTLAHGVVDEMDRELVIDVLSVFVLIELFRTFTDYLEFHRVRLRVLTEVGIAFILREIFIGLYDHSMNWPEILALAALLAVLVTARIAAVQFPSRPSTRD
jgi:uncharacterized membrane protein (DUF373 family)